jgi:hypothetical protein
MKIPHYDEHGQPIGEVDIELPDHPKSSPARLTHAHVHNGAKHQRLTHPVLETREPIVDVKMHDLPDTVGGASLAVIITIVAVCAAGLIAILWTIFGR